MSSLVAAARVPQVVELTKAGKSAAEIAEIVGITKRSVQRIRSRTGIAKPKVSPMSDDEKRRAEALLDDGASQAEVARTLGRTTGTVRKAFPGRGWTYEQVGEYNNALKRNGGIL